MKRMMITFGMILASCAAMADTEVVDGIEWTYTVSDGKASVGSGRYSSPAISKSTTGAIAIPSKLGGYLVASIEKYAFDGCSGLTSVTIPEGVTYIGYDAFYNCSGLTHVTIPSSVTSIDHYAFYGCSGLGDGVVIVDNCVLGINGTCPTSIVLPQGARLIADYTFSGCRGLTSVTMPSSMMIIGTMAFCDCVGLTSVTIPSNVTSIGSCAFQDCSGLTSVMISEGVTSIGSAAFCDCVGLTSVTIPSSVTSIGSGAFRNCNGLTSVTFEGDAPALDSGIFDGTSPGLVTHVKNDSTGWFGFFGRKIAFDADGGSATPCVNVNLTITNVVIHYMTTNAPVEVVAPISADTGIVNVMTEVKGGNVAIPDSWAKGFPTFEEKFGSNFTDALTRQTGKYDCNNTPMLVWQDYVAGTDPTNPNDTFTATITMVGGVPQVQWKPVLTDEAAAKRVYRKFGKVKLTDEWAEIPSGHEADYNFFKVTVEMK